MSTDHPRWLEFLVGGAFVCLHPRPLGIHLPFHHLPRARNHAPKVVVLIATRDNWSKTLLLQWVFDTFCSDCQMLSCTDLSALSAAAPADP